MSRALLLFALISSLPLTGCFDKARYAAGEICQCAEDFGELTARLDAGEEVDMLRLRNESIKAEQCVDELLKGAGEETSSEEMQARVEYHMADICPETMESLLGKQFIEEGRRKRREKLIEERKNQDSQD